ncbi:MAG: metallophosphoesterase [Planctomycetota bacterium]
MIQPQSTLTLPPLDFQTWFETVAKNQGTTLGAAMIVSIVIFWIMLPKARGGAGERKLTFGRASLILVMTAIATGVFVVAGYFAIRYFHQRVAAFFIPVGICFWSLFVAQPLIIVIYSIIKKTFASLALGFSLLCLAVFVLFVEPSRLEVLRAELTIPTLPRGTIIKITHFTDLQTISLGEREIRALEASNAFQPDFVVITGDLMACGPHPKVVEQTREWINAIQSKTTVYLVNGDSDDDFDSLAAQFNNTTYLKDTGIEATVAGAKLWIAGIDNKRRPGPPHPKYSLQNAPAGATRILLSHNPDRFFYDGDWKAELGFAGHTHGGQVKIPFYGAPVTFTKLGRLYSDGVFDKSTFHPEVPFKVDAFAVCAGLGMEGGYAPRVRFLRGPQVILLTIKGE